VGWCLSHGSAGSLGIAEPVGVGERGPLVEMLQLAALLVIVLVGTLAVLAALAVVTVWQMYRIHKRKQVLLSAALPDPCGYAVTWRAKTGDRLGFALHSTARVDWEIRPLAQYAPGETRGAAVLAGHCEPGPQAASFNPWQGCGWSVALEVDSAPLASDVYVLEIRRSGDAARRFCIPFVLAARQPCDVLVVASTNTWAAYNSMGGWSNYRDEGVPRLLAMLGRLCSALNISVPLGNQDRFPQVPLSYLRPPLECSLELIEPAARRPLHLAGAEASLLALLKRSGIAYGVVDDWALAHERAPSEARLWLLNTHNEYWSSEMIGRLRRFLERGGSLGAFSGNTMYRGVQFIADGVKVDCQELPFAVPGGLLGGAFLPGGYMTSADYRVVDPGHFLLAGTGVAEGQSFADGGSGHETDKLWRDAEGFDVVAVGNNAAGPAFLLCRETPQGGVVVNVGSTQFTSALPSDPVARAIVLNCVRRALQVSPGSSAP
jgi:hypothetical protein